ncbi:MAG: hypothetical protein LBR10_10835 [Prevotellaceae bacterium]|jgi:hypothetical protein|nr:hypothetical protein [Prevotellaceae bacterium]
MKKLLFILCFVSIFNACTTKEDKAKALIKKNVLQQLPDEKSYNPIEFGKLDTAYSVVEKDSLYLVYQKKLDDAQWILSHSFLPTPSTKKAQRRYETLRDTVEQFRNNYHPKPIGWKMSHTFKANIGLGIYEKIKSDFFMNWGLDSVYYNKINIK